MNRRRALDLLLVASVAFALAGAGGAPPARVNFSANVIEASNPPKPASTVDAALLSELQRSPIKFTQYKSLGIVTGGATVGQTWSSPLASSGLTLEATPKSVSGGTVTAEVKILRGGSAVVTSTVRLSPGSPVIVGGPTIPAGSVLVVLSAR